MLFLLDFEKEFDFVTQDSLIVKQQLDKRREQDHYDIINLSFFYRKDGKTLKEKEEFPNTYQDAIPIGSIQFVNVFLQIFHSIDREESIEIPKYMQTARFLKRDYKVVSKEKIPRNGFYFIKDISEMKSFSFIGDCSKIENNDDSLMPVNHLYLCSEIVDIFSEYRVYVINSEIKNISLYSGSPLFFPDLELIMDAVDCYLHHDGTPTSFSIDFMVTDRGTAIVEIHSFLSLGLFWTKWDESLIDAYIETFRWCINNQKFKLNARNETCILRD